MRLTVKLFAIVKGPELVNPIYPKSVGHNFYNSLKKHLNASHPAILDVVSKKEISYESLLATTCKLSRWMRLRNYKRNDVISICSENSIDFFKPTISALYNGLITATVNHTYTEGEILHTLELVKPKIAFCSEATFEKFLPLYEQKRIPYVKELVVLESLEKMLEDIKFNIDDEFPLEDIDNTKEQTALILFSSGTTGHPKGVMLSHYNLNTRINQAQDTRLVFSYIDDTLVVVPFYHALGYMVSTGQLIKGQTVRFTTHFNEHDYLHAIQTYKIPYLVTVPPLVLLLAKSPNVKDYDLSSVKQIICGAAPLSPELEQAAKQRLNLDKVTQAYGQTEVTFTVIGHYCDDQAKSGCSGRVLPGHEVKIRHIDTGKSLGPNQVGEICVKGPAVMQGYFDNPVATKETFTDDGWLRTGDMAYYDREGGFFIVDRLKELIKYKGFQVAPAELEDLLLSHKEIKDAAVVGLADERRGELPVAFVVKKKEAQLQEEDVLDFIEKQVSRAKRLHKVKFVEAVPKTASGKILRKELRKIVNLVFKSH